MKKKSIISSIIIVLSAATVVNLIAIMLILSGCSATPTETTSTPEVTSSPIVEEEVITPETVPTTQEPTPEPTPEIPEWLDPSGTCFDIDFISYFNEGGFAVIEGDEFDTNAYLNCTLDKIMYAIFITRGETQPTLNPEYLYVRFYPFYENDPFEHNPFCIEVEVESTDGDIFILQFLLYTNYNGETKYLELAYNDPRCNAIFTAQIKESAYLAYFHEGLDGETMSITKFNSYEDIEPDPSNAAGLYRYDFFGMSLNTLDPTSSPEHAFGFFDPDYLNPNVIIRSEPYEAVEIEPGLWGIDFGEGTNSNDSTNASSYPDQSFYNLESLGAKIDGYTFKLGGQTGLYMLGYWTVERSVDFGTGHVQMRSDDGLTWRCVTSGPMYDSYWSLTSAGWTSLY